MPMMPKPNKSPVKELPRVIRDVIGSAARNVFISAISDSQPVHLNSIQWSEGSRDQYTTVNLDTCAVKQVVDSRPWPQSMSPIGLMDVPPRHAVVRMTVNNGKKLTPTVYVRFADLAPRALGQGPKFDGVMKDAEPKKLGVVATALCASIDALRDKAIQALKEGRDKDAAFYNEQIMVLAMNFA